MGRPLNRLLRLAIHSQVKVTRRQVTVHAWVAICLLDQHFVNLHRLRIFHESYVCERLPLEGVRVTVRPTDARIKFDQSRQDCRLLVIAVSPPSLATITYLLDNRNRT